MSFQASSASCFNYDSLVNKFSELVNKHAPLKFKTLRGNHAPFMNKELKKAIYTHVHV